MFWLAVGLWTLACDRRVEAPPDAPLRIGIIAPLTGPLAQVIGIPSRAAAEIAVEQVNAEGGLWIEGRQRKVEILIEDSLADPSHSVEVVRRWIGQEDLVVIVGPMVSSTAIPVAELAESYGLPMLTPSASSPKVLAGKQWVFRLTLSDTAQGWALGHFAVREAGPRCAVLFDQASDYSRGLAEIFVEAVEAAGGEVVASEAYVTGEEDFSAALERIQKQAPDALFLPNYHNDLRLQLAQIEDIAMTTQLIGTDTWSANALADRPAAERVMRVINWDADRESEIAHSFYVAYGKILSEPPSGVAVLTYDAMNVLFEALERGGPEAHHLRQQLLATEDFQGVTGTISFHGWNGAAKTFWLLRQDPARGIRSTAIDAHDLDLEEALIHQ